MVLFCQQCDDSKDEERAPKIYKHRQINKSEDKERQDLLADYKNDGYILFPPPKVSNRLLNLGDGIKSMTYLINIELKRYQEKY